MARQALEIHGHVVVEFDAYAVVASAGLHDGDIAARLHDALTKQETHGQFFVVAGRAHRDRYAASVTLASGLEAESNLQRFLYGDFVTHGFAQICAVFFDLDCPASACHCM
jgi:hypothetical protein